MTTDSSTAPQPALTWTPVDAKWTIKDIGAPLLASLAEGLYTAEEVLREYVQNGIDSYALFRQVVGRDPLIPSPRDYAAIAAAAGRSLRFS